MSFFFFNDTATTEIYTLSLHDALPICAAGPEAVPPTLTYFQLFMRFLKFGFLAWGGRSEEHTSELQSHSDLVCRLLLEKTTRRHASLGSARRGRNPAGSRRCSHLERSF